MFGWKIFRKVLIECFLLHEIDNSGLWSCHDHNLYINLTLSPMGEGRIFPQKIFLSKVYTLL